MKLTLKNRPAYLFAALFFTCFSVLAQPANDLPCNAIFLPVDGITYYYDNNLATADVSEVSPPAGTGGNGSCLSRNGWCAGDLNADATVWFTFQAPASGKVIISTCDVLTVIDGQVAVYSVGTCSDYNSYTLMGANDDDPNGCGGGTGFEPVLYLDGLTPGNLYYIQVDGYQGDEGTFGISLTQGFGSTNDNICNAQPLTIGATVTCSNNTFATAAIGEPAGSLWANNDGVQNSVWYSFVAPASGKVYMSTDDAGTFFDTQIGVYASSDNTCNGTLTEVGSDDDSGPVYFVTSELSLSCLRPGNTYFIQVDGYAGAFGDFCLLVNDTASTTGLTPNITSSAGTACAGTPFTVTSTATGGVPGPGGTYSGSNNTVLAIPDVSAVGVSSSIPISGSTNIITPTSLVSVTLNITHTFDGDLDIYLVGPGNCGTLELSTDNGGGGDNYTNTIINTTAAAPITSGIAPFTGTYRAEGTISGAPNIGTYTLPATPINGCPISGSWTLRVFDDATGDLGTLDNWSLSLTESFYQHSITGSGTFSVVTSGANNSTATASVTGASIGINKYITTIKDVSGCEQKDTVEIKVYDTPQILSVSSNCSSGSNGSITINASTLNNGNFTLPADIGKVQYSFDGGTTWDTLNTKSGLASGNYSVAVRNSANPSCINTGFTTLQASPALIVSNTGPVCAGTDVTVSGSAAGGSQFTFSGNASPGLSIPDNNTTGITSALNIYGTGSISATSIVSVTLNITHTFDGDLDVYLVGPGNCGTLELTTDNGGSGDNYVNTVLNTSAATLITSGTAPFTGTFRPEGTITGTNTNTYGLPTTAINGCPVSGQWRLRVFDDAAGDLGTLNNWSLSLTNNGNFTHTLTGPGTISPVTYSGANNANGSFNTSLLPIGSNQFIYNVTTVSGCSKTDTVAVKVFDTPLVLNINTTCSSGSNGTIDITSTPLDNANFTGGDIGAVEYSIDNGNSWSNNSSFSGLSQGLYNIFVRNSARITCSDGPYAITLSGGFTADAGPDTSVCSGSPVTLTAIGGTSYVWSTTETTASINVAPTQTTIYSVTVSDNSGCSDVQTVTVTILTPPSPNLGNDTTICAGSPITLTASGGGTYLWGTGETTASITVTPVSTTVYSVTVTNGCTGTDNITVNLGSLLYADLTASVSTICEGGSLVFTSAAIGGTLSGQQATYTGSVIANLNIPDGSTIGVTSPVNISGASVINTNSTVAVTLNINHTWLEDIDAYLVGPGNCGTLELTTDNGTSGDNYVNTVLNTSATNIIGTAGNNTAPFTGTFRPEGTITGTNTNTYGLPTNGISGCPVNGVWTLRVFDDDAIIVGSLLNWSISITADKVYQHTISGPGTVSATTYRGNSLDTALFTITGVAPGIHTFINTVSDALGCSANDTFEVKVFDVPNLVSATGTCSDGLSGEITVSATIDNANFSGNDIGVVEFSFDGGNTWTTDSIKSGLAPGAYVIKLRNSASVSCTTNSITAYVYEVPVVNANNNGPVCEGADISISGSASGGSTSLSFSGTTVSGQTIPDNTTTGLTSSININGSGSISASSTVAVTLNITHTFDGDLDIYLVGPGNCGTLELTTDNGGGGDNFTNTVLSTAGTNPVTGGTAPFTGTYLPEGTITGAPNISVYTLPTTSINGCPVNGSWALKVFDDAGGDIGILQNWSLNIINSVNYVQTITGPGSLSSITYSGQNNSVASVVASSAPVGINSYITTVTDARGCSSSDTTFAKVFDVPNVISITGGCTGIITVIADPLDNANFTGSDIGQLEYSFDGGNTWTANNVAAGLPSGNYNVYVRNSAFTSCSVGPQNVSVYQPPVVSLPNVSFCQGSSYVLDAGNSGATYNWSTTETTQSITVSVGGDYIVVVTDANGCTATDTSTVTITTALGVSLGDFQFCDGNSVTLDAGYPGSTYTWSTGETTQTITVSSNGQFSVTVDDAFGCSGSDTSTITVYPLPAIGLVDQYFCGGSLTLDAANAGSAYLWSTNETTQTISVSSPGFYSVTVADANGCINADTAEVINAVALPVNLPASVSFCQGSSTMLDAGNAGSTYLWSTGETTQQIIIDTAGNYSVTVTNSSGCTGADTTTAIINPLPNADAGQAQFVCGGGVVTLNASGGASYLWSNGSQSPMTNVSPTQTTTYYVTVTDNNGCIASDSVVVSVFPAVVTSVSNDTTVCSTDPVTLTASGGVSYSWNTGATGATITVNTVNTTTYIVTVTDSNNCSASDSVTVTANPLPNANAGSDVGICEGNILTIYGSGGGSYLWSNGATTGTITISPASTTIYTLTVTDANGCFDVDAVTVNVNPAPVTSVSLSGTSFCTTDAAVSISVSPSGGTLSGNGVSAGMFDPSVAGAGGHLITYSYTDAGQCESSSSVAVSVSVCAGIEELIKALETAQVYPNPFSNTINIRFSAIDNDEIKVQMVDMLGRIIVDEMMNVKSGENEFIINTGSELTSGLYFIHLIKENRKVSFKLSKLE
jgi:subtilisin-like proprotein convertase family protein